MKGLVLCGGKSSRLGFDKLSIIRDGVPLYEWWRMALNPYCTEVLISCNESQRDNYLIENFLTDAQPYLGPLSGVTSLIRSSPSEAVFIVACDLVYVNQYDIGKLCRSGNRLKQATVMVDERGMIFPLFCILEPSIFKALILEFDTGTRSILKVLNESDTEMVDAKTDFRGINTPEDLSRYSALQPQK